MDRQYNDQNKHGQTIQRPKETWTDNTTTKKKHGHVLPVHVSFGRCIVCPCFFWSLYCLSMFLLVVVLPVHVRPTETWTGNAKTKRNMDRQYNDQKKKGQAIQRPKETWTGNTKTKTFSLAHCVVCPSSLAHCVVCPSSLAHCVVCHRQHNGLKKKDRQHNWLKKKDRQHNGLKKKDRQHNGHCVVCPFSLAHCVVCPSSLAHCVVCPFSLAHCDRHYNGQKKTDNKDKQ
jgi:hypothetical protein